MNNEMNKGKGYSAIEDEQLKQELARLRALTDGINEPIYVTDPDTYEILFANKKAKELFGEEIIGEKCYRAFQNLNRPCPFCTNKYLFEKNLDETLTRELQNRRNKRWYRCVDKAIKWAGGKHVRFGIAMDFTGQKKMEEALQESEELFRSIVENSHDCILIVDDNFRITYANDEATRLSGYSKEEIIGQDFRRFLDRDSKAMVQDRYLRRQGGENVPPRYEFKIARKDGEKRYVEIKSTVIRETCGKARTIAQLLDVTESKRTEEERKRFEERLSALNMYGQSLNMAKDMEEIYRLTLNAMGKTLGFEFADIFIIEANTVCLVVHRGYSKILSLRLPLDGNKGIVVRAAKTGKPVLVPDVRKDRAYVEGGEGILSELAVPIKIGDKVLGVLNVESKKLAVFDENDRELLEILASHAAIAITNLKRQERLSALNEYGKNLNMARNIEEIYNLTLDAMEKTLGFEYASFFMTKGKMLSLMAQRKYPKKLKVNLPLEEEKGVTVKAAKTGKPVYVSDVRKESTYVGAGVKGMLSELAVPVKAENRVLGVLNVESRRLAAFDKEDKKLLEVLASHAATAISNLKRQEKLKAISKKLTNLMKSSTEIMHIKDMHQRLKVIAKAIQNFGWRRVVIGRVDEDFERKELVTVGLTKEEIELLKVRRARGHVWKERLGPKFEKYKISEFYYLPWSDPWIREYVHHIPPGTPPDDATTYAGVPSKLSPEEMVDWHPQDMLYAPLRTPEGKIVGILSMDDPVDGQRPTRESLTPLELFLHQAAITIENAQLIDSLREARRQLEAYADQLEQKVEERTRELKKSQEQLLKAQRLAVIGEVAGMVGHDLRNPLTSIAGAEYYLKKRLSSEADYKIKEMLALIEKNIGYSNKIINDLLDYSRETELELTENNLKPIIKETLSLVEIPKNVRIIDLTENKPRIKVDTEKIKRAFVNIIKNAIEAMPRGGTLTIKSRKLRGYLEIVFSDTGVGMSKETLEKRLWTPLFTTKAKGMGFGLPICKRFMEAHGGSISVKSTLGKGTTITFTFPTEPKREEGGEKVWVKPLESSLLTTTKT